MFPMTIIAVRKGAVFLNIRVDGCAKLFFNIRMAFKAILLKINGKFMFADNGMCPVAINTCRASFTAGHRMTAMEADIVGRIGGGFSTYRRMKSVMAGGTGPIDFCF